MLCSVLHNGENYTVKNYITISISILVLTKIAGKSLYKLGVPCNNRHFTL